MAMPHQRPQFPGLLTASSELGAEVLRILGLELLAVAAVVHPAAGGGDPLACGDRRGMADQCDQVAVAPCLNPNDAKAVVSVLVGDPLDQPGEYLPIRCRGISNNCHLYLDICTA